MNQFVFDGKLKRFVFILMGIGVLSMALTLIGDNPLRTARFWSNYLHNSVFFIGIAFMMLFAVAAFITAFAGWFVQFKRVMEAFYMFLPTGLGLLLVIIIGLWANYHHLYHWNDADAVAQDPTGVLQGKSSFLNKYWYTFGTLLIVGIWYLGFGKPMRKISIREDTEGTIEFRHHKRLKVFAGVFLPIAGFSSAAIVWQWVMSVDAHWYSTLFAWYCGASWFVAAFCLLVVVLFYLKSKGYLPNVTKEHTHDIGKYIFAFTIFWTYLWFSQYMLIWYANVGEETIYFKQRVEHYPVLFYANLVINFVLPFLILMRNDTKRKRGTMTLVALIVFFGHWLDYFLMIKPGVLHTAYETLGIHGHGFEAGFTLPGFLEIGTMLGFLGLFLFIVFWQLGKASLVPVRDPYIQESIHHEVVHDDLQEI